MADDLGKYLEGLGIDQGDARTHAATGRPLRLAVDPARFHFFDPASGRSVFARAAPAANGVPSVRETETETEPERVR